MNNEKKIQEVKKEAGDDEKLIFKFAWPNYSVGDRLDKYWAGVAKLKSPRVCLNLNCCLSSPKLF